MTIVKVLCCNYCDSGVYGRVVGDTQVCDCANLVLKTDGTYTAEEGSVRETTIDISASEEKLFNDYCEGIDKLGVIRKVTGVERTLKSGRKAPQPRRYYEDSIPEAMNLIAED